MSINLISSKVDLAEVDLALNTLQKGGVLLYPTETIFGLGCDALQHDSVQRVRNIKDRPDNQSFLVLCPSLERVRQDFELSDVEERFLRKIWPGSCTVVLRPKHPRLQELCSESGGLGVRWSDHPFLTILFQKWNSYMLSTSANFSGAEYSGDPQILLNNFEDKVDAMVGLRQVESLSIDVTNPPNLPSSVVGLSPQFQIFRAGAIAEVDLRKLWNEAQKV